MTITEFIAARLDQDEQVAGTEIDGLMAQVHPYIRAARAILAEHAPGTDPCDAHDASMHTIPCDTLLYLAAIWADHDDYQQAWTP